MYSTYFRITLSYRHLLGLNYSISISGVVIVVLIKSLDLIKANKKWIIYLIINWCRDYL